MEFVESLAWIDITTTVCTPRGPLFSPSAGGGAEGAAARPTTKERRTADMCGNPAPAENVTDALSHREEPCESSNVACARGGFAVAALES